MFYCNDNDNCYSQTTICGYDDDDYDSEPVKVVMMMIKKTFAAIMIMAAMKITKFMVGLVKITMMVVVMNVRMMMMMMKIILTGYNKDDDDK